MNKAKEATIVDAKGLVLGRMASIIAKRLLDGEDIIIINAEEAIISGKKGSIIKESHEFLQVGHFRKGPLHVRTPAGIVKKTVRGMIPRKKPRGIKALKNLKVYTGIPEALNSATKTVIPEAEARNLRGPYIKVSELARNIGWKE